MTERSRMMDVAIVPEPPSFNQLGILVLDGSGSMLDPAEGRVTKAQAVNGVVRNMLRRFKRSRHQRNFSFAVVTFDHNARLHTTVTPATDIDDSQDYDPTNQHGGGTWMGSGLREAHRIAMNFLAMAPQDRPASVVIVLMSDGRDGEGGAGSSSETLRVAEEIKSNPQITICTTFFGGPGSSSADAEAHLRALASQPTGYQTSHDAEELRKFFIASFTSGTNVVMQ